MNKNLAELAGSPEALDNLSSQQGSPESDSGQIDDYLSRTESAVRLLIKAQSDYLEIVRRGHLARNHEYGLDPGFLDPAFDFSVGNPERMPGNVVALLGWTTYDAYCSDIRSAVGAVASDAQDKTPKAPE